MVSHQTSNKKTVVVVLSIWKDDIFVRLGVGVSFQMSRNGRGKSWCYKNNSTDFNRLTAMHYIRNIKTKHTTLSRTNKQLNKIKYKESISQFSFK